MSDAARAGRLHRLHRGVYAVGHRDLDWHSHCMAAALACAPVASHASAGWLWGLLRYAPGTIDLTAPSRRHPKSAFRVHYSPLEARDLGEREGIPVTSAARTKLDLASTLNSYRLERVLKLRAALDIYRPRPHLHPLRAGGTVPRPGQDGGTANSRDEHQRHRPGARRLLGQGLWSTGLPARA